MLSGLRKRVKKAGKAPGTLIYTGEHTKVPPVVTIISYSSHDFHEFCTSKVGEPLSIPHEKGITWVNVEGLHNVDLIKRIAKNYKLHPLTVEDILNVDQRPRVEEFKSYLFITLKVISKQADAKLFEIRQLSFVLGKNFLLSFQEVDTTLFDSIRAKLRSSSNQILRREGSDYLTYRLIDRIVDEYFVVLEKFGEEIEQIEEAVVANPTPQNARSIYRLKRQTLLLRKSIWPMRELVGHLLHTENNLISKFTLLYLRDVYDHIMQAIDTLETFREMLSSMLDMYLSGLTNRMNEIMKTLTIITTIFIPITFVASIYGMNFIDMPELKWQYGYPMALGIMVGITIVMLIYFRKRKWI